MAKSVLCIAKTDPQRSRAKEIFERAGCDEVSSAGETPVSKAS